MKKIQSYNHNQSNLPNGKKGKRPHKKIQKFGKYKTLVEREAAQVRAKAAYQERVGQL